MMADHKRLTHVPKFGISGVVASVGTGLDRIGAGVTKFNAQMAQFNERAAQRIEEDRNRVAQEAEEEMKRLQAELDADPELAKIFDQLSAEFGGKR